MKNIEIITDFYRSIENKDFDKVRGLLAENFVFEGPFPEPQGRDEFLGSHMTLLTALSDFKYNMANLESEGDTVKGTVRITGKHTGPLDLSFMDGPVVEPTGKEIELSEDSFEMNLENGKVTRIFSIPSEGGGMEGILKALGLDLLEPH